MEKIKIGPQLAMLSKAQNQTQTHLAKTCHISRVALNRFFQGKSELKAQDLANLLNCHGLDLGQLIQTQLEKTISNEKIQKDPIYSDIEFIGMP